MFSVAPVTVGSLVAPRGGARIEIYIANEALSIIESPLVEGRELK